MRERAGSGDDDGASGTGRQPRSPFARVAILVPVFLALIAEAAWITVIAGLVQEYVLAFPSIQLPVLAIVAGGGALTAHVLAPRLGSRWPAVATILTLAIGAGGWLFVTEPRAALAAADLPRALSSHPGGWLVGLAFLRGTAYSRLPIAEPRLGRLLGLGIAGLAVAAVAGGMISEPWRGRFLADALVGATVFAAASTLALSLARIGAVGEEAGFDWRRNPFWVALLLVLVGATAAVALPASRIAAPIVTLIIGAAIGPFILVSIVLGFSRRTVWILGFVALVATGFVAVVTLFGGNSPPKFGPTGALGGSAVPETPPEAVVGGALLLLVIAAIAAFILIRLWARRGSGEQPSVHEIRMIDRGGAGPPRRLWHVRRRARRTPGDAVAAYRALIEDLDRHADLRRRPDETPSEHAGRLRRTARTGLSLDLIAADYVLARYGGVDLSPVEHRRAVQRWNNLRRRLRGKESRG
jgi:hypothetical protein